MKQKLKYLSCSLKHFIPKATMLQPNDINSDVHLTNSYTHVKFERVLSDIYRLRYLSFYKCSLLFMSR